jgi:hypothetical protein
VWDMTPCSLIEVIRHFGRTEYLRLQGQAKQARCSVSWVCLRLAAWRRLIYQYEPACLRRRCLETDCIPSVVTTIRYCLISTDTNCVFVAW